MQLSTYFTHRHLNIFGLLNIMSMTILVDNEAGVATHRMEHLLSQLMMFLPRPPSSRPGWKPPFPGRGGFCASSRFSILTLMSRASVKNASSTLILALAEVSMNFIPYSIASCSPLSFETCKCSSTKQLICKIHISRLCMLKMVDSLK